MKTISKTLIKLIALSIIFASCNTQTFRYYKALQPMLFGPFRRQNSDENKAPFLIVCL